MFYTTLKAMAVPNEFLYSLQKTKALYEKGLTALYVYFKSIFQWYKITQLSKNVSIKNSYSESFCRMVFLSI